MVLMVNCRPSRSYTRGRPGYIGGGEMPSHQYEEVSQYSELLIMPLTISRCKRCGQIWVKEELSPGQHLMIKTEFDKGPPSLEDLFDPSWDFIEMAKEKFSKPKKKKRERHL